MKSLTLYIDKWYIIAAVCNNGVPTLVKPSNRESRFWLYFYDGGDNDTVVYGTDNKQTFLSNTLHYYGDIFNPKEPDITLTPNEYAFIDILRESEKYYIGLTNNGWKAEEARNEAKNEEKNENALRMIESGKLTLEDIAVFTNLPLETVKALASQKRA